MPTFDELKNVVAVVYILPTFLLYFIILYTIFFSSARKKFTASFYWIFGFSAINYIIHTISYYIVYRMNSTPWLVKFQETWPSHSFLYPIIYIITYSTAHGIHTYSMILCFNRCSIFIFKAGFKPFWEKYLKFFLAFCIILPLALVWHMPFLEINKTFNLYGAFWISKTNNFAKWWDASRNLFIEILITSFLSLIMNIYVIIMLIKLRYSKRSNSAKHKVSSQDRAMIFYSMLIFLTELASAATQFMINTGDFVLVDYVLAIQFVLADISTLAPAWFVFAMNKDLRKEIIEIVFGQTYTNVVSIQSNNTVLPNA